MEMLWPALSCVAAVDKEAEGDQPEAVQQPGAEETDGCFPIHTLQYLPASKQLFHVDTC